VNLSEEAMQTRLARLSFAFISGIALLFGVASCGGDDDSGTSSPTEAVLLAPEGNRLHAYAVAAPAAAQIVIPSHADDPENGRDINGQICFEPGTNRFISGEDTGQPNPPPGWGFFELSGATVGELSARQIGKLTPTFQGEPGEEGVSGSADPYGCGFLSDGRLVTTDIGNTASGPLNGQLIIWFPPLDAADPTYCKLDVEIGTSGGIYVDPQDRVYVASARGAPGIHRYTGPFPTSHDAAGGCGRTDSTVAPLTDETRKELFIAAPIANGIAATNHGTFFVSNIVGGMISEYDSGGTFVRTVLQPPEGESLGENPFSTGTPLGLTADSEGTLYYADLGLVVRETIGPGPNTGSVRRIRFVDGEPLPPETLEAGLTFPDGLGVFEP
jgi:hypothetical protein